MSSLYIGLICGTSMDGIDAALVDLDQGVRIVHALTTPYPESLRQELQQLVSAADAVTSPQLGRFDSLIGAAFADATQALLGAAKVKRDAVSAIGSHGQNVYHSPDTIPAFSLQLGDPNVIAERTGIQVVADFRRRDVAAGGQGAPLAPALHQALFASEDEHRAVLNLGGIANLTLLPIDGPVSGFDTGPANCLLDEWILRCKRRPFDIDGQWAQSGNVDQGVLNTLLTDPYFSRAAPKSTGREYFNLDRIQQWLDDRAIAISAIQPRDLQRTLLELTVSTITEQLRRQLPDCSTLLVCGGGVHNGFLLQRLEQRLVDTTVCSTADYGLDPEFVEAALFAWLAKQRLARQPGNITSVTGAAGGRVLGGVYAP